MKAKFYLLIFIYYLIPIHSKSQSNNDILNLLVQRNLISQEDADSLRSEDALKTHEANAKKKIFNITGSKAFQLSGYTQVRYQIDDAPNKIDGFDIRRAYLDLKGNLTSYWRYRFQADFANSPKIVDVFVEYIHSDYLNFTIGQFALPFSLENLTSNTKLDFIDRSQVVEAVVARGKDVIGSFNGRDIGVQVGGILLKINNNPLVEYKIGLFNGSGTNQADKNESKDIVGRINVNPIKGLSIGTSYYNGVGNFGVPATNSKRERFGIEASFEYSQFSVKGEFIKATDNVTKREGYYLQAGYYVLPQKLQLVAKYDEYDPNITVDKNTSKWYIAGVNYTLSTNLKLMANYTIKEEHINNFNNNLASVQLQIVF
jgi:phosphate-selective porin OprO and OprP